MPGLDTYDDAGNLAASNSSDAVNNPTSLGFGPAWRRYITSGLYNSEFALPTADLTQSIDNVNNPLPYWNVVYSGSGAQSITAQWLADSASASGGVIRFTMTAASLAGDGMQLEQLVALNSSRSQNWCYQGLWVTSDLAGATGTARSTMNVDWIASDGVTVVGTGMSVPRPFSQRPPPL